MKLGLSRISGFLRLGTLLNRAAGGSRPAGQTQSGTRGSASLPESAPGSGGILINDRVAALNRWREQYNPLRGLTLPLAIGWLEQSQRGWNADLQWAFRFIEMTDPDLLALVERRLSALTALDWDVVVIDADKVGANQGLAVEQQAALRETYERIDNLTRAIEHLGIATFRGYAHLEKYYRPDGALCHLELLDQWNVVRDGLYGGWKYNPAARQINFASLPDENLLTPEQWVIRTVDRPINRYALLKYLRSNLAEKDWDGYLEIYGIPEPNVIGPPNVAPGKEKEFEDAAHRVATGGGGYLPNGSQVVYPSETRGMQPFEARLRWLQQQLILAGTGGLLTMLTQSGSGTLAGGAHQDTFALLARAEAKQISEVFQAQLDAQILAEAFPGQPVLAHWQLAATETVDPGEIADQAQKFRAAGYQIDAAQLSERSGYTLSPAAVAGPTAGEFQISNLKSQIANRAAPALGKAVFAALAEDLAPIRSRLEKFAAIEDPEVFVNRAKALVSEIRGGKLLKDVLADPAAGAAMQDLLARAARAGARGNAPVFNSRQAIHNSNDNHDHLGRFASGPSAKIAEVKAPGNSATPGEASLIRPERLEPDLR